MPEHCFLLEVEVHRGPRHARRQGEGLPHHYRTGGFAESQGALRSEFRDYPFRVLMVFKTEEPL